MNKFLGILLAAIAGTGCKVQDLSPADFETYIKDGNVQIVDVRTPAEFSDGHIDGAVNIDYKGKGFREKALDGLDKSRPVAVYCRSGRRSAAAARLLARGGFSTVVNLSGGILAWKGKLSGDAARGQDSFELGGGSRLSLTCIKHGSLLIDYRGRQIQVDPVGKMEPATDYASFPKADIIIVTHEHGDHLDPEAIEALEEAGKTIIVTNARCAEILEREDLIVMANGDSREIEGIRFEAVPAYNYSEGRTQFHPKGRDNGFTLTFPEGFRLYIAGDTEDIPEMAGIKDIDVAFLPCNQPYTMTVEQLARAARTIAPKVLFPYHYSSTDLSPLKDLLEGSGIELRIKQYQ